MTPETIYALAALITAVGSVIISRRELKTLRGRVGDLETSDKKKSAYIVELKAQNEQLEIEVRDMRIENNTLRTLITQARKEWGLA